MRPFPIPSNGSSLLLSFRLKSRTVVIVGSGKLAASRAFTCLEADSRVVVLGRGGLSVACEEIQWRVERREIEWRSIEEEARSRLASEKGDEDEVALASVLSSVPSVSFVCITDTLIPSGGNGAFIPRSKTSAYRLYDIASRRHRIPTNTTDMPSLCDFSFPSTHRFRSTHTGEATALQVLLSKQYMSGSYLILYRLASSPIQKAAGSVHALLAKLWHDCLEV